MIDFEQLLDKAVGGDDGAGRTIPGAAMIAANKEGEILYSKSVGSTSVDPGTAKPMELDTVCFAASMTKLVTSIAAMQCVERGLISLDDDISNVLAEWKDPEILEGFEEESGKPILRKALNKITLSGLGYDVTNPNLMRYRKYRGEEPMTMSTSIKDAYFLPLAFEPGEGWEYGPSVDWAGKLVERLNGDVLLGDYFQKNIFNPLGMTSTTFDITARPELHPRLAGISVRGPSGEFTPLPDPILPSPPIDHCGGIGLYSTASDYIKILVAVLGADAQILGRESVDALFAPQLQAGGASLMKVLEHPMWWGVLAKNLPSGTKVSHGLGGLVGLESTPTGRKAGAMQWGGLPNLFWWIDPAAGVCGTVFAQITPTGDEAIVDVFREFERGVYRMVKPAT